LSPLIPEAAAMRVFMLGWEFPPFISGGLGTACYGLTRGLDRIGVGVTFVLPKAIDRSQSSHVQLRSLQDLSQEAAAELAAGESRRYQFRHARFESVEAAALSAYARPAAVPPTSALPSATESPLAAGPAMLDARSGVVTARPAASLAGSVAMLDLGLTSGAHYDGDLFAEIERYAALVCDIARRESFDVIHAHDWMTFPAGMAVAGLTGRPLVVQIHSTEFDRSGLHVNQRIYDIERAGVHAARQTIAVSHWTRNMLMRHYGADGRRVVVIHNAIDEDLSAESGERIPPIQKGEKVVLFLGRVTMQKGPEYFLQAARLVLQVMPNVRFVMAGSGDMIRRMIELAAELGIGHKVLFTGFLRGNDVKRVFQLADLYVMPSVSEPFGIAPLEAMQQDVPVIISKQSGVAEVLTHVLKVDFWAVEEMANKIVAVLRHPPLHATLKDHGSIEVRRFSWTDVAHQVRQVYEGALQQG
jgi:glycogen(starch) synthase